MIDTEWRSCLKWDRLSGQIDSLDGRCVLDVGCGNGYYLYRMLGCGARAVVGADPTWLYVMQFHAINRYVHADRGAVLPLDVDDVPASCDCFDSVFSMGLLYHRRRPQDHLAQLFGFLRSGGQLVLETLVLDRDGDDLLVPEGRYAKMRNVWAIPAPALLLKWLSDAGFRDARLIHMAGTTPVEQRKTDWMTFESLGDFLDPGDPSRTVEGYPAPVRAVFLARKP